MAEFTRGISPGDIDTIYSRTAVQLGTRFVDQDGGEYIFLKGVASTVAGSWVTYDSNDEYQTTLLATGALGSVAVAQAATVAGKYGWYCIWGTTVGKSYADAAWTAPAVCGRTSADGSVGQNPTAGDVIYGAFLRSSMDASSGNTSTTFQLMYPFLDAQTAGH